jgi:hypothetical protein
MLHELDRELEKQKLRFVRYADDFSIYFKTKSKARRVGNLIYKFLRDKLKLKINREKSGIRRPVHFTLLGFGFVPTYKHCEAITNAIKINTIVSNGERGKYQLVVSVKSWCRAKRDDEHL